MARSILPAGLLLAFLTIPARADKGFALDDKAGQHLDVRFDGRLVARYMYAHDKSDPKKLHDTYKPYLHVLDPQGKTPITKGPGGQYTHHRGIFVGWNKIGFAGKVYDRWHMKGGEQVHQKFLDRQDGPRQASFTSLVHWNDDVGKEIVEEKRTMTVRPGTGSIYAVIDITTTLSAPRGEVTLDGDPEHAGVQFRPANEIVARETVYIFPKEKADPKKDRDYPWVGETFVLAGKKYSVAQLSHPDNPRGTIWSAYRDYGRFGAFFKHKLARGESLTVKYRFLVAEGEFPETAVIQKAWDDFAGVTKPSPVPKTTVKPVTKQ